MTATYMSMDDLDECLFEKESVCISYGSDDPKIANFNVDGTLRLIKKLNAPVITWTPRDHTNDNIPAKYRRMIEIDLRDMKCFKRDKQKVGYYYPYMVFILQDGTTYPPMEFRLGGSGFLVDQMKTFLSVTKSREDSHVYTVRMYDQTALFQSFDQLDLYEDNTRHTRAELFTQPRIGNPFSKVTSFIRENLINPGSVQEGDIDIRHMIQEDLFGTAIHSSEDLGFEVITKTPPMVPLSPTEEVTRGPPVTLESLVAYIDHEGRISCDENLKKKIFRGGLAESIRPKIWKYLLGYFKWSNTDDANEERRKQKIKQYFDMKFQWQSVKEDQERRFTALRDRRSLIEKDVNRTDRTMEFFKNFEDGNLTILHDILMTYTMYNFDLGYVQGMNDLLAPILLIMKNEVDSFWCFAGLMDRMEDNFTPDQLGMKKQFSQLHTLLQLSDPPFSRYIESQNSQEMFFCFRWLLVHFKREFFYKDILLLWETLWTDQPCKNYHLLVALAILDGQKETMLAGKFGFNEILKHTNDQAYHINLEIVMNKAEAIWNQINAKWSAVPEDVRDILSFSVSTQKSSDSVSCSPSLVSPSSTVNRSN